MDYMKIRQFCRERDKAFIDAVTKDDWEGLKSYARRWGVPIPSDKDVMKAGIYKAVQECDSIPQDVKSEARSKCVALGFRPTMWDDIAAKHRGEG